jgi:glyoxylase-like metal-dependent hydrolase (beta-lactamase superfamily II)
MPTSLELRTRQVGPYSMNAYALVCPATKQSVLIDPGDDADALQEMLKDTRPIAILLTHTHFDHVGALTEMRSRLQVQLLLHHGPHAEGFEAEADYELEDGDTLRVGENTLRVFFT